jgi:hypothetical protein
LRHFLPLLLFPELLRFLFILALPFTAFQKKEENDTPIEKINVTQSVVIQNATNTKLVHGNNMAITPFLSLIA